MNERCRAVGADQLDAAIEKQITEQRRENTDEGEAQKAFHIERHGAATCELDDHGGNQKKRATAHVDDEKRERMNRRPPAQICGVKAVDHQRHKKADIAAVEGG